MSRRTILIRHPIHVPALHLLDSKLNPRIRRALYVVAVVNLSLSTLYALYLENLISAPPFITNFFERHTPLVYMFFGIGLLLIVRLVAALYETVIVSLRKLMMRLILSYILVIYSFGLTYFFMCHHNKDLFNIKLDFFTSIYFSVICITTVGFGDVYATADATRGLVSFEVLFGVFFNVFAFSVVSSLALQKVKFQPPEVSVAVQPHTSEGGAQGSEVKVSITQHEDAEALSGEENSDDLDAHDKNRQDSGDDASARSKPRTQEVSVRITPHEAGDKTPNSTGDEDAPQEVKVSIHQPTDKKT